MNGAVVSERASVAAASHSHSLVYMPCMKQAGRQAGRQRGREEGRDLAMNYAAQKRERGREESREGGQGREIRVGRSRRRGTELDAPSASVRPAAARPLDQWDSIDQIARHFTILLNYRNGTAERERERGVGVGGGGIKLHLP